MVGVGCEFLAAASEGAEALVDGLRDKGLQCARACPADLLGECLRRGLGAR